MLKVWLGLRLELFCGFFTRLSVNSSTRSSTEVGVRAMSWARVRVMLRFTVGKGLGLRLG